ncbi:hypothetical protein NLI96_g12710 [Meripilus lineatus]|uniref:Uncharacterized protein n=1 Tax=Meripilus lineatus TaxID=2056292 RepID=A0AAD5YC50_9APHY|nr:hypothetical protein NLI96_g12710 [Physisporinus lineatus]
MLLAHTPRAIGRRSFEDDSSASTASQLDISLRLPVKICQTFNSSSDVSFARPTSNQCGMWKIAREPSHPCPSFLDYGVSIG